MVPDLTWDDSYRADRGKVLSDADLEKITKFSRYLDSDGDGIPYRTLPGCHPKGANFNRGAGHNKWGGRTELSDEYQDVMDRLLGKWAIAATLVPKPEIINARGGSPYGILTVGSCDGACKEALARLGERGINIDYLRVKGFPFSAEVEEFLAAHQRVFVIEQNRDAQMRGMLLNETEVEKAKMTSVLHYDGMPMDYQQIVRVIEEAVGKEAAA